MVSDGTRTQAGPPFSSRSVLTCSIFNCGESKTFTVHSTQNTSSGCRGGVRTGGGFCQRKEDEVTLEDPVQEENDAKSESHVIKAFLTCGHSTKPLLRGKEGEGDQWQDREEWRWARSEEEVEKHIVWTTPSPDDSG